MRPSSSRLTPISQDVPLSQWLQTSVSAGVHNGMANIESRDSFDPQSGESTVVDLHVAAPLVNQRPSSQDVPLSADSSNAPPDANDSPEDASSNSSFSVRVNGQNLWLQSPELQAFLTVVQKNLIFLLVLLAKIIFNHGTGALILMGVIAAFVHCNSRLEREVSKQSKRHISSVIALHVNLMTCLFFVLWICEQDQLLKSALILPTTEPIASMPSLLWHVCMADYLLKFLAIFAKACVVALPFHLLPVSQRGKYFLFIEQCSQLHRTMATVQPWLAFLLEGESGVVATVMVLFYMAGKCRQTWHRLSDWRKAFGKLLERSAFGTTPNVEELEATGPHCPICQDDFVLPSCLPCKHIFCQDCLSVWLDSHKTCPMCRAEVADDPSWRDGTTDYLIQLF